MASDAAPPRAGKKSKSNVVEHPADSEHVEPVKPQKRKKSKMENHTVEESGLTAVVVGATGAVGRVCIYSVVNLFPCLVNSNDRRT